MVITEILKKNKEKSTNESETVEKIAEEVKQKEEEPMPKKKNKKTKQRERKQIKEARKSLIAPEVDKIEEATKKQDNDEKGEKINLGERIQDNNTQDIIIEEGNTKQLAIDNSKQVQNLSNLKEEDKQINLDISMENMDGILVEKMDEINQNMDENYHYLVQEYKKELAKTEKCIVDCVKQNDERVKKYSENSIITIVQNNQKFFENIINRVNEKSRDINNTQEKIASKFSGVRKRIEEFGESVESMEGDLHKLSQLDQIVELLKNKGLTMSMEIPPINAEEEDIINLVRYSKKITEQLGYAARDFIRKQEAFRSQAKSNENEQEIMTQKIENVYKQGINEGKKQVIKQLLSRYEDIDAIKESQDNYVHTIWTVLTDLGVMIDGEGYYEKGQEIDLLEEDIQRMMATYSKLEKAGKYKVIKTGLSFQGEIISAAQFKKINEEEQPK